MRWRLADQPPVPHRAPKEQPMNQPAWQLIGPHDGAEMGVTIAVCLPSGTTAVLAFDERGMWDERATVPPPHVSLAEAIDAFSQLTDAGWSIIVVSNRSDQSAPDRPDDEFVYEEMRGVAQTRDILLLDWYIVAGQESWSVAEFTPSGAGWDAFRRRGSSFTAAVKPIRLCDKP